MMTLGQAQAWIPGARLVGDPATPLLRVHTDTRTLAAGDLFVALKGERFDANQFLGDAKARGAVAEKQADHVVVTSDNPRGEQPAVIISQILLGLASPEAAQVEPDRARAIAGTLARARPEDVVLIAGKGHEAWQESAGERLAFSDRSHVIDALTRRSRA
jgi:UDP-N-acetylmuramyl tripeptide synthase